MSGIDQHCFPHILDAVVDSAPAESLLKLRACSSALRARADRHLFAHVECVVASSDREKITMALQPFGSCEQLPWFQLYRRVTSNDWVDVTCPSEDGSPALPLLGMSYTPPCIFTVPCEEAVRYWESESPWGEQPTRDLASSAWFVAKTRVVDVHPWEGRDMCQCWRRDEMRGPNTTSFCLRSVMEGLGSALALPSWPPCQPYTLRRMHDVPNAVPKLVTMPAVHESGCFTYGEARSLLCRPGDVASSRVPVCHVRPYGSSFMRLCSVASDPNASALVDSAIHLLRSDDATHEPVEDQQNTLLQIVKAALWSSCWATNPDRPRPNMRFRITVVGGAAEFRAALRLAPDASWERFASALDEAIKLDTQVGLAAVPLALMEFWTRMCYQLGEDISSAWRKRLRFLSPAEYEAEVGVAQVALETKADPYRGAPAVYLD
jgi:hypothetical protein